MDDQRLQELSVFTPEGKLSVGYGQSYLFFVGRDDVHGIMKYLIEGEKLSFKMNMFGYDDDELNQSILNLFTNPTVHVQISLDKSQAGGVHEKKLIAFDQANDPTDFANSFTILESASHQISHTKGGVLLGQGMYFEGSTNWSNSGEGTGISLKPGINSIKGFKAQNNTLLVSVNSVGLNRFSTQLDVEHIAYKVK
jgi:hypothetical protein